MRRINNYSCLERTTLLQASGLQRIFAPVDKPVHYIPVPCNDENIRAEIVHK